MLRTNDILPANRYGNASTIASNTGNTHRAHQPAMPQKDQLTLSSTLPITFGIADRNDHDLINRLYPEDPAAESRLNTFTHIKFTDGAKKAVWQLVDSAGLNDRFFVAGRAASIQRAVNQIQQQLQAQGDWRRQFELTVDSRTEGRKNVSRIVLSQSPLVEKSLLHGAVSSVFPEARPEECFSQHYSQAYTSGIYHLSINAGHETAYLLLSPFWANHLERIGREPSRQFLGHRLVTEKRDVSPHAAAVKMTLVKA